MSSTARRWLLSLLASALMSGYVWTETYSVSGKVTDARSGNGLEGAMVVVGGQIDDTDVNGDYTVSNVPEGEQTITAALDNYTIPNKPIDVTGDMVGQNLVATGDSGCARRSGGDFR